jgi:hypothetical protein
MSYSQQRSSVAIVHQVLEAIRSPLTHGCWQFTRKLLRSGHCEVSREATAKAKASDTDKMPTTFTPFMVFSLLFHWRIHPSKMALPLE